MAPNSNSFTHRPIGPDQCVILFVDDDVVFRRLIEAILAKEGYHTLAAQDGIEALEVARGHEGPIHLLLTDVLMPRMDGVTLCKRLAAERPETALLLISGEFSRPDLPEDIPFLPKPFPPSSLAQRVRQMLLAQ